MLLRLAVFTGNSEYERKGALPLRSLHQLLAQAPGGTAYWLGVLDFYLSQPKEIALIGPGQHPATQQMRETIFTCYLPNKAIAGQDTSLADSAAPAGIPLLENRAMLNGNPTAFVCQNYICQLPVTDATALAAQLDS